MIEPLVEAVVVFVILLVLGPRVTEYLATDNYLFLALMFGGVFAGAVIARMVERTIRDARRARALDR